MKDKRTSERRETFEYWSTLDTETGRQIGRLVDLNREGLRLHCETPIAPGSVLKVAIHVDRKIAGRDSVDLTIKGRWCRRMRDSEMFAAGFAIVSPPPEYAEVEKKLVNYFSRST